jgi:glucan phosphorylase
VVSRIALYLPTPTSRRTRRDRDIAHQLYGGDRHAHQQEIVLGMGGVRPDGDRSAAESGTSTRATTPS